MKTISISKIKYVVLVVIALFAFSCSPEDGKDGIDGLQGEQGIQGQDGTDGENGTDGQDGTNGTDGQDGTDGNANVIDSGWIISAFAVNGTNTAAIMEISDSNITEEVAYSAAILAFGKSGTSVASIPLTLGNRAYYFVLLPDRNEIGFLGYSIDQTAETFSDFTEVRYIIIPSNTTGKNTTSDIKSQMEKAGVDLEDYYAVCDYLGLEY